MASICSSLSTEKEPPLPVDNAKLLPILFIPGFMSSGLKIEESKITPEWEGERIWLNLSSIGISSMYFGKATNRTVYSSQNLDDKEDLNEDEAEECRQANCKSSWLKHMMLASDRVSDAPGIKVRNLSGLGAVDYLTPGPITSHVSYVFGPVQVFLESKGYNPKDGNINLMAAPYDWRLAPSTMEKRDQYFTKTMGLVEELYNNNNSTPVVLLSHSLGTKVAHYFLNFALDTKGQSWIDKYFHTYMASPFVTKPIGAPHLGAPKAMRGLIAGDKMGLETFLRDEEALLFSRGLGSLPWMIPSDLPEGVPGVNYILPHGILELSIVHAVDVDPLVNKRSSADIPKKYGLMITGKGFDGPLKKESERMVRTLLHPTSVDHGSNVVVFTDKFSIATETKPYYNETLQFLLHEPGLASARKEEGEFRVNPLVYCLCCLCIPCALFYKALECVFSVLVRGATLTADAIASSAGESTTLAFSEGTRIPKSVWDGKSVTIKVPLYHVDDYGQYEGCMMNRKPSRQSNIYVKLKWKTFNPTKSFRKICSPICRPSDCAVQLPITTKNKKYEEFSGYDILEREGLEDNLRFIKNTYDLDKHGPRSISAFDPPPINRIHAIYGVNLQTEVGCVYSRQDTCLSKRLLQNLYTADKKAVIDKDSGYTISNGVIMETPKTKQKGWGDIEVCGDATVPYWSLAHVKTWQSEEREVTVLELDKADHRHIMSDSRFHKALFSYCCGNDGE